MLSSALLPSWPSGFLAPLRAIRRAALFPPLSPVRLPVWSGLTPPASPGRRGYSVVLNWNSEDRPRNELGRDESPRTAD
jgi:hypothetical protein